jgi:hypothetical protein
MNYYPSGCDEIQVNDCNVCVTENARVRKVALIHKDYYSTLISDAESPSIWITGILANKIIIYPETNGEYDGGVPTFGRGFATAPETLLAYKFAVNINEPNYQSNRNHWNKLAGSRNYYVAYCSENIMNITTKVCNIIPKNKVDNDLKAEVVWNIDFKWSDFELPLQYNIPQGVFQCGGWTPPVFSGIGWMTIGTTNIVG